MTFLSGWKTYIAAALAALGAADQVAHFLPAGWSEVIFGVAGALGLIGIRHAIAKNGDAKS